MDPWTIKPDSEEEAEIKRLKGYAMQLEATVRAKDSDIEFLKRGHLEVIGKLNWKISKLESKVAELEKSPPLPFDPTPFLIDGKHLKDG